MGWLLSIKCYRNDGGPKCMFGPVSLFFRIWSSAKPQPIPNKFNNLLGYKLSVSMCMRNFITINSPLISAIFTFSKFYEKVQEIGPFSPFSEFQPRQNPDQSQMSFDNPMGYILSISMCMRNFITIFHSVQEIGPFSLFQNLELGKASTDEKCHFAISWARSCQ